MHNLLEKINKNKSQVTLFITLYFFIFLTTATYSRIFDDITWMNVMDSLGGIFETWKYYTMNWQPRFPAIFFGLVFDKYLWLWKCVNPLIYTVSVFTICKFVFSNKNEFRFAFLIIFGAFFVYTKTFLFANVWLAGSSVYNLGFCSLIVSMIPFFGIVFNDKKRISFISWVLLFVFSLFATWQEQPSVILAGFAVVTIITKIFTQKKFFSKNLILSFFSAWIIANTILFNVLNLSSDRINFESHRIPEYDMLSILDKIFVGVNYGNYHVIYLSKYLFLICTIFTAALIYIKYTSKARYIGFIPLIYSLGVCIPFDSLIKTDGLISPIVDYIYNGIINQTKYSDFNINFHTVFSKSLIPSALALFIIVLFGLCQFMSFSILQEKMAAVSCYGLGMAASYVLAFTGAFYVVGPRSNYYTDMMLVVIFAMLLRQYLSVTAYKNTKLLTAMKWGVPILGSIFYVINLYGSITLR